MDALSGVCKNYYYLFWNLPIVVSARISYVGHNFD